MPECARDVALQAGADDRRLGDQQRHRLPLHVGTHQRAVGIVMLEERNQTGRDADHLARGDVDVLDLVRSAPVQSPTGNGRRPCRLESCRPSTGASAGAT